MRTLATEIEGLKETEENAKKVMRDSEDSYNTLLEKLDNLERESLQVFNFNNFIFFNITYSMLFVHSLDNSCWIT